MHIHQEVDQWMYDIEQELKYGQYKNRSKLQRKHMVLSEIRDKLYADKTAKESRYSGSPRIHKYCQDRYPAPGTPRSPRLPPPGPACRV